MSTPDNHISTGLQIRLERGQALAEYALILAFVSIAAVGLTPVGQWAAARFADVAGAL